VTQAAAAVGAIVLVTSLSCRAPEPPGGAPARRWCDEIPRPAHRALERVPVSQDWFQVYRVGEGVFAITEPFQFQETISYLIVGSTEALLFDTGLGIGRISGVAEELTPLPVTVLNSHTHFDHVGGNAEFDRILAMDTAYTRANAAGFPHAVLAGEVAPAALCRPLPAGVEAGEFCTRPFAPSRWLRGGEVLDLGGRRLSVLPVPGHTPDAVALYDEEAGLLFTGDTFYEGPIWLFVPETSWSAYAASADPLAALVPRLKRVHPAHNSAVSDPRLLIELQSAVREVSSGRIAGRKGEGDRLEFPFGKFSFVTSRAILEGREAPSKRGGSGLGE
jgi:glyoxylase-like metal-dependent hydrolase (beta-lactamase superfamily II)